MKTFNFYKDEKNTIWTRLDFSIEAESYEKALEKIKAIENNPAKKYENEFYSEYIYETLEMILPEENKGQATCEIYFEDTNQLIYTNEIKTN